ncbi:dimethyladenosine transferase [Roseivirga ehrenbergii]|uniref:Ribosomal RNA small subunit methyltransferase A n=1 Tax=Roseivirga ehrenbergii (strain DSM 102268 / JCM 13514 / KCTC 12282 / NCIMB 14502 / KMM 6017) TaxID=279360 RepID=A0A150XPQ3_ROSEK|nr:16S rRNA (adenine(1518)-N(6)/adenine(1519)-N(6))-dimethyltransferase RsmA [Roseivirga ehrenbergii]KYG80562.1 16S rRNA methyltransferase [Roseivirga ehrenbergii]TCL07807.1 dimethyladenosine transferase [Roseivirga ehrenbergii]
MSSVRPKKHLGQHFLKDLNIAKSIADGLTGHGGYNKVVEIGPGTGVLTQFLLQNKQETSVIEIDRESVAYLKQHYPQLDGRIIEGDFLKLNMEERFPGKFGVVGNFPYNISSQIFFKVLDLKQQVPEVVCMIQKEVADRLISPPGNKAYGILSVFLQAYYELEYLFTVPPNVFNPPPKVNSAVIRLKRNEREALDCDEVLFRRVVKAGFQMRRKTLRNALKPINLPEELSGEKVLDQRAETLSVDQYVELTNLISSCQK